MTKAEKAEGGKGGKGKGGYSSGKASGKGKDKGDKGKGKGKGKNQSKDGDTDRPSQPRMPKEILEAVTGVCEKTLMRLSDLDPKAKQFLEALHAEGQLPEACTFLEESLEKVSSRDKVLNWQAYVFSLLRKYGDGEFYEKFRESRGRPKTRERSHKEKFEFSGELNKDAMEFVPGAAWESKLFSENGKAAEAEPAAVAAR